MVVRTDRRHRTFPSGCFWFGREGGGQREKEEKKGRDESGISRVETQPGWSNPGLREREAARHSETCDERARGLGPTTGIQTRVR